jgi:predicted DNA binding CopG/RHH family protein
MASLAAPAQKSPGAWDDDNLGDDIATLSYESALRSHARYRSAAPTDQSLTQAADTEPRSLDGPAQATSSATQQSVPFDVEQRETVAAPEQEPSLPRTTYLERNLKDASITIRMSKAECAQLHQRADEAGLTVSAYLRSCTFEAESLRAMVKDTLAQLRSATAPVTPTEPRRSWFHGLANWVARLLTPWHGSPRVARA